jgi:hypothetical protein
MTNTTTGTFSEKERADYNNRLETLENIIIGIELQKELKSPSKGKVHQPTLAERTESLQNAFKETERRANLSPEELLEEHLSRVEKHLAQGKKPNNPDKKLNLPFDGRLSLAELQVDAQQANQNLQNVVASIDVKHLPKQKAASHGLL